MSLIFNNATLNPLEMKDKRLLLIFITVFIDLVGFGIIIPMNPYLAREFGASPVQVGWLMSIYSLMQFVFAPLWGQLSDRFGRRPVLLLTLMASGVSHLGFSFAQNFEMLFFFRLFAGVGGGNLPVAMAYIADITDKKDRSKGMGLIGAAFGLGFIMGPAIGGVFSEVGYWFGDQAPFGGSFPAVVASLICFLNALGAAFYLPETLKEKVSGKGLPFKGPLSRLKNIFIMSERTGLGRLYFIYFLTGFSLALIEMPLFLYVDAKFGWGMAEASFGFAYIGLMMVFTQGFLIRKLLPKLGEKRLLPAGLFLFALGLGGNFFGESPLMMLPFITALAVGYGLANPSLMGSISLLSSQRTQGENLGVAQSLAALARITGPVLGGVIFEKVSMPSPFIFGALCAFLGLVLCFKVLPKLNTGEEKL